MSIKSNSKIKENKSENIDNEIEVYLSNMQKWSLKFDNAIRKILVNKNYLYCMKEKGNLEIYEITKTGGEYEISKIPKYLKVEFGNEMKNRDFVIENDKIILSCCSNNFQGYEEIYIIIWNSIYMENPEIIKIDNYNININPDNIITNFKENCITLSGLKGGYMLFNTKKSDKYVHVNIYNYKTEEQQNDDKYCIFWCRPTELKNYGESEIVIDMGVLHNGYGKIIRSDGLYTTDRCIFSQSQSFVSRYLSKSHDKDIILLKELKNFIYYTNFDSIIEKFHIYSNSSHNNAVDVSGRFSVHPKKLKSTKQYYQFYDVLSSKYIGNIFSPTPDLLWKILDCNLIQISHKIIHISSKNKFDIDILTFC